MTKLKKYTSLTLRKLRLLYVSDWIRFKLNSNRNNSKNQEFKSNYPEVVLPPDYLIYESFQIDYTKYYLGGKNTAEWLVELFQKHIELKNKSILDLGCGPGRIVRHLPEIVDASCSFFGTDCNANSIKWCKSNIKNVDFNLNNLDADLPYKDNSLDVIYGISIFTRLSEKNTLSGLMSYIEL